MRDISAVLEPLYDGELRMRETQRCLSEKIGGDVERADQGIWYLNELKRAKCECKY